LFTAIIVQRCGDACETGMLTSERTGPARGGAMVCVKRDYPRIGEMRREDLLSRGQERAKLEDV
jgi:hypothetical protein